MLNTKLLGGTASAPAVYVDDVFSTYLYNGTGATQTITNDIDLSGKGGLVWIKARTAPVFSGASNHAMFDTVRGANRFVSSNTPDPAAVYTNTLNSFNSNGFTLGVDSSVGVVNYSTHTYCSWTFREQAKFFDVVTFTGTGSSQVVSHNLGSTPGMVIVKRTDGSSNWLVWHRSLASQHFLKLNETDASADLGAVWCNPTSTNITFDAVFGSGQTWVAYIYAHNAGGFGAAGTDNVISCGTFTTATSTLDVTLGYEPQYVMFKRTDDVGLWQVYDNMRGFPDGRRLAPNSSAAEDAGASIQALATGFNVNTTYNATFIYMAIRRPMKPPTSGTEVFSPVARTGNGSSNTTVTAGFPVDMFWNGIRDFAGEFPTYFDRLRGNDRILFSNATSAEFSTASVEVAFNRSNANTGVQIGTNNNGINGSGYGYVDHFFRRASGFFDEVCYTGTGSARTVAHNLGVVPELMIVKYRNVGGSNSWWAVYSSALGASNYLRLNAIDASASSSTLWNATAPTASVFSVGSAFQTNDGAGAFVAYLFATCAGVSKVGSYTGNGSSQTINCGFTAGARFVLIKRTDSTGDWVVLDTARGIVSGNDPFLQLNSTAAEVTGEDIVDPANSGFIVNSTTENINASGGTYIYLAIA